MSETTTAPMPAGTALPPGWEWGRVEPLYIGAASSSKELTSLPCLLMGWCIRETSGTSSSSLNLWDGSSNGGSQCGTAAIFGGGQSYIWFGPQGVSVRGGLYFENVSGAMTGVVYVRFARPAGGA